jgi:hypothetical protein
VQKNQYALIVHKEPINHALKKQKQKKQKNKKMECFHYINKIIVHTLVFSFLDQQVVQRGRPTRKNYTK